MKRLLLTCLTLSLITTMWAQGRIAQNNPYTDLRPFHFGVVIGINMQDIELSEVGLLRHQMPDGTQTESIITADQDRYEPGFIAGVLGELRLSRALQLRLAPTMYFGTRHLLFIDMGHKDERGKNPQHTQQLKTAYLSTAADLIWAAQRNNNFRPYLMAGVNPMINLNRKKEDILRLRPLETYLEIGAGCDLYFPFFKLRPELKFLFGLSNNLNKGHEKDIKDKTLVPYTLSVREGHGKMVVLSFYFE